MKLGRRGLMWIALAVVLVLLGGAALYFANDWWLSGVMTVSIFAWLAGILAAIYSRAMHRPAILGAVLAGFLYVLFALGPWFRVHVGPWLLTSQALVQIETKWLGRQPQTQQQLALTTIASPYNSYINTVSGVVTPQQVLSGTTLALVGSTTGPAGSPFLVLGHRLCGWVAAGLGAIAAAWISLRAAEPVTKQSPGGEP